MTADCVFDLNAINMLAYNLVSLDTMKIKSFLIIQNDHA